MSLRAVRTAIGQVFAWLIAGLVVAVLTLVVVIPRVGGGTAYTILTDSMRPTMPAGTLVVVRHEPANQIRIGDVVTYQLHSGRPEVVTHRVSGVSISLNGDYVFTTRGDANSSPDPVPVRPQQIRGVRWYDVPYLAWPTLYVGTSIRAFTVMAAVIALFGYAAWSFGGALLQGRRRRRTRRTDPGEDDLGTAQAESHRTEVMR